MTFYSDDIAVFNKERALFLKELSLTPGTDINALSQKLSIPQDRIWGYLKGFLALIAESSIDSDYIRVRDTINHGVELEYQIEDNEVLRLVPLIEKYGDTEIIERFRRGKEEAEARRNQPAQTAQITHEEAAGQQPRDLNQNDVATLNRSAAPTMNTGEQAPVFDYGTWNVEILNKGYNYSFFAELTRIGLMRWTLQNLAIPPRPTTVESWMRYYELNQDTLMSDPMHLREKLKNWFGEKTGEQASELFNSYIRYLKPREQFGVRKLDGVSPQGAGMFQTDAMNPMFGGMRFTDPYNTYYHTEGVLPFGMDARSGDATRLIREYEQEKRRKKEQQQKRDELLEDIRTKIQMDMTSFLDRGHGGNGNGLGGSQSIDQMYLPLVLSGQMKMIPYANQDGKTEYRYEVVDRSTLPVTQDPSQLTARDMLEYMKGMYDLILQERTSKNHVGETLMDRIVARALPETPSKSPVIELMENWKALKEVAQPAGGWGGQMSQTLDAARIMLERDKFVADKERSEKLIDRQFETKQEQAKIDLEREKQANETKNLLIKNVGAAVTSSLPTLFQLVLMLSGKGGNLGGAGGAAPGGGGLMSLIGNLLGGGGLGNLLGGGNQPADEEEGEELLPPIGKATGGGSATSGGSGMGDIMGQMSGLFGNLFGGAGGSPMGQSAQPQQQSYRPNDFQGISAPVAQAPPNAYSIQNEAMKARNPTGYQGVFAEVQQKTAGQEDAAVMMPGIQTDFNPYVHAGIQPQPQQIPVPDTNRQDVYQSQYAQVLNASYLNGNPFPQQPQHVVNEPVYLHPQSNPQQQFQPAPNQVIEIQREEEPSEDEYRTYSPTDFEKLSPSQLDEAYQKGQASKQSIDSYLNSVEARRTALLKQQPDVNININSTNQEQKTEK